MTFERSEAAGPPAEIGSAEFGSGRISQFAFLAD
jgi:hypothetical protein